MKRNLFVIISSAIIWLLLSIPFIRNLSPILKDIPCVVVSSLAVAKILTIMQQLYDYLFENESLNKHR